jgi:hypothetical protein
MIGMTTLLHSHGYQSYIEAIHALKGGAAHGAMIA